MAPADESRQLAKVAAVTDDLDRNLDRLFANVAELREILEQAAHDQEKKEGGRRMSETPPPGSWPGLESHGKSVLGADPLQTARDLQGALEGMTKQLAAVQKTVRRGKFVITALAVLLVLVIALGVGFGATAIKANDAGNKANAASVAIHASQVTGCQVNNAAKNKQAGLWAFVVGALQPPATDTRAQKAAAGKFLGKLEQHIANAYQDRDCQAAYKAP